MRNEIIVTKINPPVLAEFARKVLYMPQATDPIQHGIIPGIAEGFWLGVKREHVGDAVAASRDSAVVTRAHPTIASL